MKKIFATIIALLFLCPVFATTFEAGVSIEKVPKELFGSWRVNAKLDSTNSYSVFKPQSVDFWNLSRIDNTIKLENPYSGANATVTVQTVEDNVIVFSKKANFGQNKILTDTVTIRLNSNTFRGINTLKLESFSLIDNHIMKTETATYHISGEKISGDSVIEFSEEAPID